MKSGTLNYRYITTQLIAFILLMLGFRQFAFLMEFNIVRNLSQYGIHEVVKTTNTHEMMNLFDWLFIASILGFHVALIASIIITLKKKVPLVNLLIVFTLSFVVLCIQFLKFETILNTRSSIVSMFHGSWFAFKYIVPGILFITLGLLTFFNPWANKLPQKKSLPAPPVKMPQSPVRWGL